MQIISQPKFSERTTLRLGGKAIAEVRLTEKVDENALLKTLQDLGGTVFILGGGSNLLVSDEDLDLTLVRPLFSYDPKIVKTVGDKVWITVGSGMRLPRFLGRCAKLGLSGLEGLCGIPGTVGGAIAMNAGSFGTETCAHLDSLTIFSPRTGIVHIDTEGFSYAYRKFLIPELASMKTWFFIIDATFVLTQTSMNGIKKVMSLDFLMKKSRQPISAWSAGCVFKNPAPDKAAGMLLDQCGFKGKEKGGMRFSSLHANFLINEGKGCSEAAFELIQEAQDTVKERYGIDLELEVKRLCP